MAKNGMPLATTKENVINPSEINNQDNAPGWPAGPVDPPSNVNVAPSIEELGRSWRVGRRCRSRDTSRCRGSAVIRYPTAVWKASRPPTAARAPPSAIESGRKPATPFPRAAYPMAEPVGHVQRPAKLCGRSHLAHELQKDGVALEGVDDLASVCVQLHRRAQRGRPQRGAARVETGRRKPGRGARRQGHGLQQEGAQDDDDGDDDGDGGGKGQGRKLVQGPQLQRGEQSHSRCGRPVPSA
eukprot:scaffold263_cov120-Isochrysis_galbana.AAC.20